MGSGVWQFRVHHSQLSQFELRSLKANSYFHAARGTRHAARSTDHFNSYFHAEIMQSHDQIYCLQWKSWNFPNYRFSSVLRAACRFVRAACSVLRACNGTMGIHSFNFSSVLRAAWKYELALSLNLGKFKANRKTTI